MMMYTLLVTILLFAADAASLMYGSKEHSILGGRDAEIEDYTYQVSVQIADEGHFFSASIISEEYVLTAAHRLYYPSMLYTVRSGSSHNTETTNVHKVVERIFYNETTNKPDIAIPKVNPPFKFDNTQQPIKLADERPKSGSMANLTAWGNLYEGKLQTVQVPIVSARDCGEAYDEEIPEHQICAGNRGVGSICNGDPGAPLVVEGRQVGILARGWACMRPEAPGVYMDVAHCRKWIKEQTNV